MNKQRIYQYLTLAALMGFWSCSSSQQTAQNAGEVDDLYGNSGNAVVYASNSSDVASVAPQNSRELRRQQRSLRNANPDYNDEQQGYSSNTDEYYSELSTRKLNRGLSDDPGWGDSNNNSYNAGFVNGYNAASTSAYSWNRWGFNNFGFYSGLGLGMGLGGFNMGFGRPFYSPFYGSAFAYSPFNSPFYGGFSPFYDSFYSPYAYSGFYSPFYSPFYGGWGGGYGGYWGSPVYVNNVVVTGADPYRARVYNRSAGRSAGSYVSGFDNSPRNYNPNGGRSSYNSGSASTSNRASDSRYYSRPSNGNSRGTYYYDNGSSNGRVGNNSTGSSAAPSYNSGNDYYARPRSNSRGSYTAPSYSGGGRSGSGYQQQSTQSYQQPSYQSQSRGSFNNQPSFSQPSAPSRSFSSPSPSSGGGGGFSGGGGRTGGGGRGPR